MNQEDIQVWIDNSWTNKNNNKEALLPLQNQRAREKQNKKSNRESIFFNAETAPRWIVEFKKIIIKSNKEKRQTK
jgi:hypothetical protein